MAEKKYGKYINREAVKDQMPVMKREAFPFLSINADSWSGHKVNCNFAFQCVAQPYLMPDPPHAHPFDEFLFFIGGDPKNVGDFGAVIEMALGEEWEINVIDTTSIVYLPAGLQHCPINVKKVDKPFWFGHIMLSPTYSKL